NAANNSSTALTTISTSADLAVSKTGPSTGVAGNNLTYTLTVSNNGPSDAQGVTLSDLLPSSETFVSQSQTSGSDTFTLSNNGNQVSDTIATLPSGHSDTITIIVKVNANVANGAVISNTAMVSSSTSDPNNKIGRASWRERISTSDDLAVSKAGASTAVDGH